jgi:phthiodiolone/phenolphthiodiolone dimycocerosates ketoreductase
MGASSVWLVDHYTGWFPTQMWTTDLTWMARRSAPPNAYFDWQVLAGALAGRCGPVQLAVGVTDTIRRHPVSLAQAALTMSHLTDVPPILGVGAGEAANLSPYGIEFARPVARLEEGLQVVRLLFDSQGPVDFHGEFFHLEQAILDVAPGRGGRPQLWVAAHGPRMLTLTGRYGDGWYPAIPMAPPEYAEALAHIEKAAAEAGRDPASVVAGLDAFYVVGRNDADVRRQLEHPAIRFLALLAPDTAWRRVGLTHPMGRGFRGMVDLVPVRYGRAEREAAIDRVPVDLLATQIIAGTPDQIVERLRALAAVGMRHVVLNPVSPLVSRRALTYTLRTLPGLVRRLRTG